MVSIKLNRVYVDTCSKKQEFVKEIEKLGKCGYYLVSLRALLKKLIQEVKNSLDLF